MSITIAELNDFRKKAKAALDKLGEETGFKLDIGKISYDENTFTTKMTAIRVNPGETQEDLDKKLFIQHCWKFDMTEDAFGKEFPYGGKTYKIVGINPKATKNNILVKDIKTGTVYVMPDRLVSIQLKKLEAK